MEYKIFVSANQKELRSERFAVKEVINDSSVLRSFFDVFLFEDLPAKGKSPKSTYLQHVVISDIYICIIGQSYGDKDADGLSATEREFSRFLKANPDGEIIAFIKGDASKDTQRDKDTQNLVKTIKTSFIYRRFHNVDELKVHVLNSLISFLNDKGKMQKGPFDENICLELDYDAIDEKTVKDFLQNRAIKLKVKIPRISIKKFLVNILKIVKSEGGKLHPTNAALLFFGKNPSEYITHHEIRIARFQGTDRIRFIDSQEIKGPIYKMIDQVETFFLRNTRLANKIVEFKRIDIREYPFEAIREAIVNAIAHRDYLRRGAPIMISIFDDRIEVSNPGALLPGLNIKKLEGHHRTRNEMICHIFHETMDMEKYGTGIKKMKGFMREHGLNDPQFSEEGDFFVVRFKSPGDKILDLVPDIPVERQTDLKALGLNERQIEALRMMINEKQVFSNRKYREILKVTNKTAATDLNILVRKAMINTRGKGRNIEYGLGLHDSP